MYSGRKPKHHNKSQGQYDYRAYSQSDTTLRSWEYAENPRERKHVKFDKIYDSSHDIYHGHRQKNEHNQPYYYGSSNMYDSENEIFNSDSEDSRYTYYHQSPQHIMYTGTDSALAIGDSDYESTDFGYQPKYNRNYDHGNKNKNYASTKNRNIKAAPLREDFAVYFAQQPTNTFKYRESTRQNELSQSDSEFQTESITEIDEESDYPADVKRNKDYQVYVAHIDRNENNGPFMKNLTKKKSDYPADDNRNKLDYQNYVINLAGKENNEDFKKDLTKNSEENVISVTEYDDNIPILAFKTKNTDVLPQKSDSRVVYLPVIVTGMQSKETIFSTINNKSQNFPGKNVVAAEKPMHTPSSYEYAAMNKQTDILEKSTGKIHGNAQHTDKTEENKQQQSTVVKGKNTASSPDRFSKITNRKSSKEPVLQMTNTSCVRIPSILKMPGITKSKSFVNVEFVPSDQNQLNQSQIKISSSNVTVSYENSIPEGEKSIGTPSIGPQDKEMLKYKNSDNRDKKVASKTKSCTSNISKKSIKCNRSIRKKSRPLIGETPTGNKEGCNYYAETHWRENIKKELTLKKEETARKSQIIKDEREPKTSFWSKRRKESVFSMAKKGKDNNIIYSRVKLKISRSEIKPDESEFQRLSEPHQNCSSNKDLPGILKENETKNRTQSFVKQIVRRPQRRSASVVETNIIINKIGPSQFPDDNNHNYEGDTETKLLKSKPSDQIKSEPVIRKSVIAKESIPVKNSKIYNKISIMLGLENNTANKENNAQLSGSPPSNQNKSEQGTKKSITARESTIRDTITSSPKKDKSEGNKADASKKSLVKENVAIGETIEIQLLNPNQTGQDIKKNVIDKKEDQQQLDESKNYQSKAAEEVKDILRRRSLIKEYLSKEKMTEDSKKSNVTHTSGPIGEIHSSEKRKSQVFWPESKEKINEEIRASFANRGITNEQDKRSSKTLRQSPLTTRKHQSNQISGIKQEENTVTKSINLGPMEETQFSGKRKSQVFRRESKGKINEEIRKSFATRGNTDEKDKWSIKPQRQSPETERKNQFKPISSIKHEDKTVTKNISLGPNNTSIRQTQSSVGDKVKIEGSTANLSERKIPTRECSKENLNNNQKIISQINYKPVGEQKHKQTQSSAGDKVKKEGSAANLSERKIPTLERECSKENLNNNQKSISQVNYIPVGEQKHKLRKDKSQLLVNSSDKIVQKRFSSDQKVENAEIENAKLNKISQKTSPDKSSLIDQTPNQSKRLSRPSHGREASNTKSSLIFEQTKLSKTENLIENPITVWGQDIFTLITYCFRICQFFLGVSTYDKFIEVMGNFH